MILGIPVFRSALVASALSLGGFLFAVPAKATITTYTDQTSFLNAISMASAIFTDNFVDLTPGQVTSITRTGNGLSVVYTAPTNDLYPAPRTMSSNNTNDNLIASLGPGIYAAGGNFYLSDINGAFQPFSGQITSAQASNGIDPISILSSVTNSTSTFFGWISTTPLVSVTSTSGGTSPNRWNTLDNFTVATAAVPGPLPMAGALSAFACSRRLRRRIVAARLSQDC